MSSSARRAAGLVACALADIELSDLGGSAVAAGWLARARHHLGAEPGHPGHVLLEALNAYRALAYEKNPDAAQSFARRSVEHARRAGDAPAEIMGNAFLGFVAVSRGDLARGFGLLDEATTAAWAGELPPLADLDVYCLLISACARVRDLDRADQWAQRVLSLATREDAHAFAAFARTQYASLLIWRGRWGQAETEIDRVLVDAEGRPMTAAMAMVLRSCIRRRQGRLDDADAALVACEREPYRRAVRHLVLAARAALELDRGRAQEAADLAERYLRAVAPSDLIERVEALEILVRARVTLGDLVAADAAARDLESAAAVIPTTTARRRPRWQSWTRRGPRSSPDECSRCWTTRRSRC
jgi:ATP/maltotriose-dependent transcriptional regulator MalT